MPFPGIIDLNLIDDEIVTDIGFCTVGLEQRRDRLLKRGRRL